MRNTATNTATNTANSTVENAGKSMAVKAYLMLFFLGFMWTGCQSSKPVILMQTDLGDIKVRLEAKKAPVTVANFLKYVDEDRWTGANFYRVVRTDNQPNKATKIEVIQGGLGFNESTKRLPSIIQETTAQTGLHHLDGTISMARSEPNSADSEFFICINNQPELDFGGMRNPDGQGFAAFGRVIRGMDVVRAIQKGKDKEQMLETPVVIRSIKRIR